MNLQGSPSHWPISNRKVALIFLKLKSGTKRKTSTETKILKNMPFRRPKRWTSYGVLFVDPFPIEKLHKFKRNWILAQKKTSTEMKNFLKCNFGYRNDRISLKNDDSPGESFPLTYFQSKSCTNLPQTEFRRKKKRPPKRKFWKKCHFGGWNDGIWPKKDEPLTESYLLTHFQSKSCTNLSESRFWRKKKGEVNEPPIFKSRVISLEILPTDAGNFTFPE